MYSIGEFARLGAVSVRTLRHYDELGLLSAAQVDLQTGYRRYRADQLTTLNRIVALKELGFELKDIARLLGALSSEELHRTLYERRRQLERELADHQARLAAVDARLRALERKDDMLDDVKIKSLPAMTVAAIGNPAPGFGVADLRPILRGAFQALGELVRASEITPTGPRFSFYTGGPDRGELIAYAAVPVSDEATTIDAPAELLALDAVPEAATVIRHGTLERVYDGLYADLARWLEAHDLEHVGAGRDVFLQGPSHSDRILVEVQMPIKRPGASAPNVLPRRPH